MREFGQIHQLFWTNPELKTLTDQAKLLSSYLLTGPHTTTLGCFRLPVGYAAEDLGWTSAKIFTAFKELEAVRFAFYDHENGWVIVRNFLKFNTPRTSDVWKYIARLAEQVPRKGRVYSILTQTLNPWILQGKLNLTLSPLEEDSQPPMDMDMDMDMDMEKEKGLTEVKPTSTTFFKGRYFSVDQDLVTKLTSEYPGIPDNGWLLKYFSRIDDYIKDNPKKYKRNAKGLVVSPSQIIRNWLEKETFAPSKNTDPVTALKEKWKREGREVE